MMTMSSVMSAASRCKAWIIAACVVLLAGCSALRLAYNQAPELAYWWLDGYLDIQERQAPMVRAALDEWFAWHRATQLPDYAAQLAQARAQVQADVTPDQVCRWWDTLRQRTATAFDHGVPALAEVVMTLDPKQVQHIERRYQKADEDFKADFLQATRDERLQSSVKRTVSRAETLYGRLDDGQREFVARTLAASPFDAQAWLAERQARQREIVQTLRMLIAERADAARVQAALRVFAAHAAQSPRAGYRDHYQRLSDYNCQFVAQLHNTTSAEQRRRAAERLKGWEDDLRALAAPRHGSRQRLVSCRGPRARRRRQGVSETVTLRGFTPVRGKSVIAARNIAASTSAPPARLPSLRARASYSGRPLSRSRSRIATSRS